MQTRSGAFGPGFIPGKVAAARDTISHALGRRWSGRPAKTPAEGTDDANIREQERIRTESSEQPESVDE